jgi:ribonucleoside-diphosphate reductase alpha chain
MSDGMSDKEASFMLNQSVIEKGSFDAQKNETVGFTVVKRDGSLVPFRKERIYRAIELAFRDTKKIGKDTTLPYDIEESVTNLTEQVVRHLLMLASKGACLNVEGIQDLVEVTLMKSGYHDVARDYIIYRDQHKALRDDSARNLKFARRDGAVVRFNPMKIASKVEVAFRGANKIEGQTPETLVESVNLITMQLIERAKKQHKEEPILQASWVADEIENLLMASGFFKEAKFLIKFDAVKPDAIQEEIKQDIAPGKEFVITKKDGAKDKLAESVIKGRIETACRGLKDKVEADMLLEATVTNFYEGIKEEEVDLALIMAARAKIEIEPAYSLVASRLLLDVLYREAIDTSASDVELKKKHSKGFISYLKKGVHLERVHPELLSFDLETLAEALDLERDDKFSYLGLQTLYDRYFIHDQGRKLETPQMFWMRVAMGLAVNEGAERTQRAIEFYNILSTFLATSSTPTLFNSGTLHPQLSSCYLSTIGDDLHNIFKVVADDAQLSKWAGGIGNDWTNVRATGSRIKGTNGQSQGVIPFLKVANDTAVAVNQGGKRKGAMCAYLETWHLDVEDFLELRKNTGDERRRTHDMNTANWIPDLFMKRVATGGQWTLFSPSDCPDLHDLYGEAFEARYTEYEKMADEGKIKLFKRLDASLLWRKMLSMLFETGHPWMTFKDPSNIRSPQDHQGVVHSSNLCTEILLNTSTDETAVCNLASINLKEHMNQGKLDEKLLENTVRTLIRMLDNVIDINFYPIKEARNSNLRHRPIGMGMMAFQDCLYEMNIPYASHEAIEFADRSMELISYFAISASSDLAKERGTYESYKGSKWDRGLLPIDTITLLEKERGGYLNCDRTSTLNWQALREKIKAQGIRNCNTMAIAPTATISNITGVTQSIEPMYSHLFVKSNLSGEFTIPNTYLVEKLKTLGLWDADMLDDLKYFDGSIKEIERIPDHVKQVFLTAFEIDSEWIIECASRRQKWIDMGESLNLYLAEPSGKKLHQMYMLAWQKGLKTTYYLRTRAATQVEKSTTDVNRRGLQPRWMKNKSASSNVQVARAEDAPVKAPKACSLEEGCESCQ